MHPADKPVDSISVFGSEHVSVGHCWCGHAAEYGYDGRCRRSRPGINQGPRASPTADTMGSTRMLGDAVLGSHLIVFSWWFSAMSPFVSLLLLVLSYHLHRVS